jgi:hypothetical protein
MLLGLFSSSASVAFQRKWCVGNVECSGKMETLTEKEVLSMLEHSRIEIQVQSNKRRRVNSSHIY